VFQLLVSTSALCGKLKEAVNRTFNRKGTSRCVGVLCATKYAVGNYQCSR
jgi:hypothetical protein